MLREQNQVMDCAKNIMKIVAKTKKEPAYIKLAVPEHFAEALLNQIEGQEQGPISQVELVWKDDTISYSKK